MKFMITWKVPPANYRDAVARFLKTGGSVPAGLKMLGRWHTTDGRGFLLVEGTETALAENFTQWADLLEIEVAPVLEDAEAGVVLSKAFGK